MYNTRHAQNRYFLSAVGEANRSCKKFSHGQKNKRIEKSTNGLIELLIKKLLTSRSEKEEVGQIFSASLDP